MKDHNTDVSRRINGSRPTVPPSAPDYPVFPNIIGDYGLQQRRTTDESLEQHGKNVAWERIKTNLIYFLIIMIVVLVGILCYTLLIIFEEQSDVIEPNIDDVAECSLPMEQRTWYDNAIDELRDSVKFKQNKRQAKNIILFVGDGMGLSTVTASRIYKYGEEGRLSWESFPHFGLLKVRINLDNYTQSSFEQIHLLINYFLCSSRHIVWISKFVILHRRQQLYFAVCSFRQSTSFSHL